MIYLPFQTVKSIIEDAIYNKKILKIKYQNAKEEINVSFKAPFDIGTTTPDTKPLSISIMQPFKVTK